MTFSVVSLCVIASIVLLVMVTVISYRKTFIHRRLMAQPLPPEMLDVVERNVAIYHLLPDDLKTQLAGRVNVFLAEKKFEGCGGLTVTDEMRVTIAALACVLLLNRTDDCYPGLRNILIYPGAYVVTNKPYYITDHVIEEDDDVLDGESWEEGTIVMGWEQVLEEGKDYGSGQNIVFHEFAHQLDFENGISDGIPFFSDDETGRRFDHVFHRAFERFRKAAKSGRRDVIDEYGAVDSAEFFAVATETFLDIPLELRHRHPDLYQILKSYYRIDPGVWQKSAPVLSVAEKS